MTLIVGIKCMNGLVLGADGAATLGTAGQPTALQTHSKKIEFLHDRIAVGVSGHVGVSQRLKGIVSDLYTQRSLTGKKLHQAMDVLRREFWDKCLGAEYMIANVTKSVLGQAGVAPALCSAIVAMPIDGQLEIIQFDANGAPEGATKALPFVAIGSGQSIADPFLAFIRRIFWGAREPNLAEGQFAVWWTLHHAIKTAAGGIADPKQIVVLEKTGKDFGIRELTEAEFKEHEDVVMRAEDYLRNFDPSQKTGASQAALPIPQPPESGGK